MGHKRFLNDDHPFRKYTKSFNGEQEFGDPPKPLSGEDIFKRLSQLKNQFENKLQNKDEEKGKKKEK